MIKILFVFTHLKVSNGVARTAINLANSLDKNLFDVTIMPLFKVEKEALDLLDDNVKVKKVFNFYFRGFGKILSLLPGRLLYKWIIKDTYDIEVSYQFGVPTKMMAYSSNEKAKHICWMHTYDEKMEQLRYYNKYDNVVCVSKDGSERLAQHLKDSNRSLFLYSIVDEKKIKELAKESVDVPLGELTFVTVSRLTKEKGQHRLLSIFNDLKNTGLLNGVRLIIVGGGLEYDNLQKYIEDNDLSNYVTMVGKQTNPYKYVAKSDVFICCSDIEGLSTSCVEAAILGVPILSTSVGGAKEINELQDAGCVVPIDTNALKESIVNLIQNRNIVEEWNERACLNSTKFYSEERIKKIENFLIGK